MKRLELLYTVMMVAAGLLMSASCVKEKLEPEQRISGDFVLDEVAEGRGRYISFDKGIYVEMAARYASSYYFADGILWGCSQSDFSSKEKKQYAIIGGELVLNGVSQGRISQTGDNLLIGNKKYKELKGFEERRFFTIRPEVPSTPVNYSSQEISVPYTIVSPSPASHARPTVTCDATWVKNLNVSDNKINFNVEENNTKSSRSATLLVRLPWADDVRCTLTQSYAQSSLSLTPPSKNVDYTGGSFSFEYAITNQREGATVSAISQSTWITNVTVSGTSVNYKVAENNSNAARQGTIHLTYGSYASKDFTVNQSGKPVQSLSLNKSTTALFSGKSETLVATVNPTDASLQWSSSNTSVATVNQSGVVTGKGNGTAKITVSAKDGSGKSASCTVTVTTLVTGITLNKTSMSMAADTQVQLTATVSPTTASDKSVTWSSSSPAVATVDQSGMVTAVSKGKTTIKATANDGSGKSGSCELTVAQNLSADGNANCYIVSSSGMYSFRTTKGNSSDSVGSVSSVAVLWESYGTSTAPSVGSIVNNVSYSSNNIIFSTPSTLKNGNAVIAAKSSNGTILWSWHIWVCSGYNPSSSAQTYYNSAGKMMDRNLGATSATPGNVGALGLLYQWGRKDPFLGSSSISSNTQAVSTGSWPSAVSSSSSNGTMEYAVKNPTTFILGIEDTSNDWVYSSRDNTLWQSTKTIYDPCPPGWRVPDGGSNGVWSKAVNGSSSFSYEWDSTNRGMDFSGKFGSARTIWYAAAGCVGHGDGKLANVGRSGYWWSCTPDTRNACHSSIYNDNKVHPSPNFYRAHGLSVRCIQE